MSPPHSTACERTLAQAYELFHPAKRVLVVEDDADILSSLAEVIRDEGFEVHTAANGYQALIEIASCAPDLIFLDLMMPRMDGWKFIEELRRKYPHHQAPLVLLSAASNLAAEAAKLNINFFLRKPFQLTQIAIAHECCAVREAVPAQ